MNEPSKPSTSTIVGVIVLGLIVLAIATPFVIILWKWAVGL